MSFPDRSGTALQCPSKADSLRLSVEEGACLLPSVLGSRRLSRIVFFSCSRLAVPPIHDYVSSNSSVAR